MLRKVALGALLCLITAIGASAQGTRRDGLAFSTFGPYLRPVPGGVVRVCEDGSTGTPCTPLQSIFSDIALTVPKTNPFSTNADGTYSYYAATGTLVDEQISGSGFVTVTNTNIAVGVASSGTVSSFSAGNLSPLFTTGVATATTTPALSFTLSTAAASTVFANCTGGVAAPSFCSITAAMLPAPLLPVSDNATDIGGAGIQWRSGYFGTSLLSPIFQTVVADVADAGSIRFGNNQSLCAEATPTGTDGCVTFSTSNLWSISTGALATYLSSNAASDPADTGYIRLDVNTGTLDISSICWEASPAAGDICATVSTSEIFQISNLGTTSAENGISFGSGNIATQHQSIWNHHSIFFDGDTGDAFETEIRVVDPTADNVVTVPNATMTLSGTVTQSCGTAAAGSAAICAETNISTSAKVVVGTVALLSATPSAVTVSSLPAFTGTNTYACTLTNMTADDTGGLQFIPVSSTSFTIEGPDTVTDVVAYICVGN